MHTYEEHLDLSTMPPSIVSSEGHLETFVSVTPGIYRSARNADRLLVVQPDQSYLLKSSAGSAKKFSSAGKLLQILNEDSTPDLALSYDTQDRLEAITQSNGRQIKFKYANGLLRSVQLADGSLVVYAYDDFNNLVSVDYGNGQIKHYHYQEEGLSTPAQVHHLTGITAEDGKRYATFGYDARGRVTSSRLHSGSGFVEQTTLDYLTADTVKVKTDGQGDRLFTFQPGLYRRELSVSDPAGATSSSYYPDGRLQSRTDKRGVVTQYEYAPTYQSAATVAVGTPEARRTVTVRDSAQRITRSETWKAGAAAASEIATYSYDAAGRRTAACAHDPSIASAVSYVCGSAVNAPLGVRQSRTSYCEQADVDAGTCPVLGLVTKVDGPRTNVSDITSVSYFAADDAACAAAPTTCAYRKGDLKTVTNALGQASETLRYDGAGRVLSMKDANGIVTDLEYHPRGWLTARKTRGTDAGSEADDVITRIDYYPTGLVEKTTLPDGSYTRFIYDNAHRLTAIEDAEGNRIRYTLDNAGNRTKEETVGSNGSVMRSLSRVVNQLGQIDAQLDAYDNAVTYTYDTGGNVDQVTDDLNRVSDNDVDPLNRLRKTIQNVGGINASTEFQYDALDNLTQVKDPKGLLTKYEYDGLGNLKTLTSPDTGITRYSYDSAGNRASQTDARNVVSNYRYDALNRLLGIDFPSSVSNAMRYEYDSAQAVCTAGETFARGRLTRMSAPGGVTQYCYDRFGQLVRKVHTSGSRVFVIRYAYAAGGQLRAITYPDGSVVDYQHDALGRTTQVGVTVAGSPRQVLLKEATYYPFGPVAEWVYGNGRLFQRTLNKNYQPGIVQDGFAGGLSLGYEFDPVGNLKTLRTGDQAEPPLRQFAYDGLNRLTESRDGTGTSLLQAYTYDGTGNRTSTTDGGVITPYTYEAGSHRLTRVGSQARTYNAMGNTVNIGGSARQFATNVAGRITQVRRNNAEAMNYQYNARGEMTRRYLGTDSTYFTYDEAGQWLGQYDNAGAPIQQIVWLDNLPVGIIASGKLYYIEADHLGTPRVVLDPQRDKTVWRWDLTGEAFGNTAPQQDPDGDGTAFVFDMRFPGQRYEAAMGMNYNYFRDYEAATGRYAQSDPIGLIGGVNTYAYVQANPFGYTDPLGLDVFLCKQPAFGIAQNPIDHHWIKTDTVEAGMGGTRGNVPGNESGDRPGDPVQVTDHSGRSQEKGATCELVPNVNEKKVNDELRIGRPIGRWGPTNQCQSFVRGVLNRSRNPTPGASGSWQGGASGGW